MAIKSNKRVESNKYEGSLTADHFDAIRGIVKKVLVPKILYDEWLPALRTFILREIEKAVEKKAMDTSINFCPHCGFRIRNEEDK